MSKIIYKYCPSGRLSMIRDLMIRISQPPILNDPFENLQRFDLKLKALSENSEGPAVSLHPGIKNQMLNTLALRLNQATNEAIGTRFGIISFSRTELSLLLWSHYAENYTGFVVGFDSSSLFFTSQIKNLSKQVQDVIYTSKRKEFILEKMAIPNGLLCSRPVEWAYEEEVRFIDSINEEEMKSPKDELGFPIVLRAIPRDTIKEIIVGPRSKLEPEILRIVEEKKLNVDVYRLTLDEESYRLGKQRIG